MSQQRMDRVPVTSPRLTVGRTPELLVTRLSWTVGPRDRVPMVVAAASPPSGTRVSPLETGTEIPDGC